MWASGRVGVEGGRGVDVGKGVELGTGTSVGEGVEGATAKKGTRPSSNADEITTLTTPFQISPAVASPTEAARPTRNRLRGTGFSSGKRDRRPARSARKTNLDQ